LSAAVFLGAAAVGLGPLLRASLALGVAVWLTGALHEDGLADSADGLGAAAGDPERVLAIMKDSRIGTYGAVALILSLLVRTAALAELAASAWFAIVFIHVWARLVPVWLLSSERYIERPDSKSQGLVAPSGTGDSKAGAQMRPRHVLVALGWGGLAAALGVGCGWLSVMSAATIAAAALAPLPWLARAFRRGVGGITGDLLGAAEQIAEICAWIAASAALAP
jgi:adenosylcobinamide-GDP ribazoletransferase